MANENNPLNALLKEIRSFNLFSKIAQGTTALKTKEMAGEDDDKREEQLEAIRLEIKGMRDNFAKAIKGGFSKKKNTDKGEDGGKASVGKKNKEKEQEESSNRSFLGDTKDFVTGFKDQFKDIAGYLLGSKEEEKKEEQKEEQNTKNEDTNLSGGYMGIFEKIFGEIVLLRKVTEGRLKYDPKSTSKSQYRNAAGQYVKSGSERIGDNVHTKVTKDTKIFDRIADAPLTAASSKVDKENTEAFKAEKEQDKKDALEAAEAAGGGSVIDNLPLGKRAAGLGKGFMRGIGNFGKGALKMLGGSSAGLGATVGGIAIGGAAATGLATGILANEGQAANRKALAENSMLGAASGDTAMAGAILDANGPDSVEKVRERQLVEKEALKDAPWYTRIYGVGKQDYLKKQGHSQDAIDEMTGKNSVADLEAKKLEMETTLGSRKWMNPEDQKKYDEISQQLEGKKQRTEAITRVEPAPSSTIGNDMQSESSENKVLTTEATKPSVVAPITNNISTSGGNTNTFIPMRPTPRPSESSFERFQNRVAMG